MKKFSSKKSKTSKAHKVAHDDDYDSMIENGTDDGSNDDSDDCRLDPESDSGQESGCFVRAPNVGPSESKLNNKPKGTKRRTAIHDDYDDEHRRKIKAMKQLYKPPTLEEINRLKETENFYHSNLFRLQVDELLREVKVKFKILNYIEHWLDEFRKFLRTVKDSENERHLSDIQYEGIDFPLVFTGSSDLIAKECFKFVQQRIVHQIGSSRLGTSYGKPLKVDLLLEIPDKVFRKEDYLNLRYHMKRAHYLCHLAEALGKESKYSLVGSMRFRPLKGDFRKPVLELTPTDEKFAKRIVFVVHAAAMNKFAINRFLPEKNNVRPALIGQEASADSVLSPTPHYNSSILSDLRLLKNQEILDSILQSDNVRQAIILLKVWISQRRFDAGYCGFDGAIVTFYIAYLLQTRKVHNSMSSYQIIRLFWNQLANSNWDTVGISMEANANLEMYRKHHEVVFLDNSGLLNICANLAGDLYRRVKQEASTAIHLLDNHKVNSFAPLFLSKYAVYTQYDHILIIEKSDLIQSVLETFGSEEDKLDFFADSYGHFRKMIYRLLRRGLGRRASFIVPIQIQENFDLKLNFGIVLNPEEAFSVLDKGPEAIDKEASDEFRDFWRGKAELRRFKDGSITESVIWCGSSAPLGEKRLICQKIVLYLLNAHLDIPETKVIYSAHQFEVSVKPDQCELHETVEERSLACIRAFDNLSRIVKNLNDLPLTINALVGTDSVFRYADPDPPRPTAKALLVNGQLMFLSSHIINATIQLEFSGKWPDQLEAIRMLKAAFYLRIADSARSFASKRSELVPQAYIDYLDIMYEKYLFRLRFVHQREITLQREYLSENKITKLYRDSDTSVQLEMQATTLPKLTAVLHGLHQQHFSFGSVAAMAKRWLYSQLIDSFLWPDECTELIVASLYMKQDPTVQPQAGFFRFMEHLANTDWSKELVLLNFNDEIPDDKVEELEKQFIDKRESFPPLAIVTSCDADKYGLFAKRAPSQEVLNRVVFLAKNVITMLEENFNTIRNKVYPFYKPSYKGYDLIINLDATIIPATGITSIDTYNKSKKEYLVESETKEPAAGFNPAQLYLHELREGYRKFAVFFYDPCGGSKIAVLWRPDALEEKAFTTSNINGRILTKEETLKLNTDALIRDFEIIGKGLVKSIERKSSI